MPSRLEAFQKLKDHPALGQIYKRLRVNDLVYVREFILRTDHMSDDEFILAANRLELDNPHKPKNLTNIWALLIQSVPPKIKRRRTWNQ